MHFYSIGYTGKCHGGANSESQEEWKPLSLPLRKTKPWDHPVEEPEPTGFADSFHEGAADAGAFDTGLTRLFSMAIIELEYILATTAESTA